MTDDPFLTDPPDLQRGRNSRTANTPQVDRLPPCSIENEQAVLGCCFLSADCIDTVLAKLKGRDVWYDLRHQTIWNAMVELYLDAHSCELIVLQQQLKDAGELDGCGGLAYLMSLPDLVASASALDDYLAVVLEKFRLRTTIQTATSVVGQIFENEHGDFAQVMDKVESELMGLRKLAETGEIVPASDLVQRAITAIETAHANKGKLSGIGSGFSDLDRLTNGFQKQQVVLVAARPSVGKTSWLMQVADYIAVELKEPVAIFSLEMSADQIMLKAVCTRARVCMMDVYDGALCAQDFPKLTAAAGKLSHAPIYIDETGGLSIMEFRSRARQMKQKYGVKIFGLDYLQLLNGGRRYRSKEEELSDISNALKSLSKELDAPIIALAQLNREVEKRTGNRPKISDLRGSGQLEADADLIGLLFEDHADETRESTAECKAMTLAIDKNRLGPRGDIHLEFFPRITRFEQSAKISKGDVPTNAAQQMTARNPTIYGGRNCRNKII